MKTDPATRTKEEYLAKGKVDDIKQCWKLRKTGEKENWGKGKLGKTGVKEN